MTTKEFKKQLIELGYDYDQGVYTGILRVLNDAGVVACTKTRRFGFIDTGRDATAELSASDARKLLNVLVKYATTPVSERGGSRK